MEGRNDYGRPTSHGCGRQTARSALSDESSRESYAATVTTKPLDRVWFVAGDRGGWRVDSVDATVGPGLASTGSHLAVLTAEPAPAPGQTWALVGTTSNTRYTTRAERDLLASLQPPLDRSTAVQAVLLPVRKNQAWWSLAQDERRTILAGRAGHIATGMRYLPAVARKLYHSRDLGGPFDFLTWFEFAPRDAAAFDDLLSALRQTEEWNYVDREIDVRLSRVGRAVPRSCGTVEPIRSTEG